MRKRSIVCFFDALLWYGLILLPLLCYFAICLSDKSNIPSFLSFMQDSIGLDLSRTLIYEQLSSLLGSSGILDLFGDTESIFVFLAWFVSVEISHLFVDFLLFIPRLSHKFFEKFYQGD